MSKRLSSIALALALGLVVACSAPPRGDVSFGSGRQFIPQVADFQDNVGIDPAVAVVDGAPILAYFGFPEELKEDEVPVVRPIGAPTVPGVLLASLSDGGFWTRGAAAIQEEIPNVTVAFSPAFVQGVRGLSPENVSGLSMAADEQGNLHIVWGDINGVWYATDTGGGFEADLIVRGSSAGKPSIAVDGSGTPWVASYVGGAVQVTHPEGKRWIPEEVGAASECETCRTAVGVTGEGEPFVAFPDSGGVVAARSDVGGGWTVEMVETGVGGEGLSMAVDAQGNPHLSYYAGSEVHAARSGGGSWQVESVAEVSAESAEAEGAATSIAVDGQGARYIAWYDAGTDSIGLASASDGAYEAIPAEATLGGTSPDVAATPDGRSVYVAWYDSVNKDLLLGTYGEVGELALAEPSPASTGGVQPSPPSAAECEPAGTSLAVAAPSGAAASGFDVDCLAAPAGEAFTIAFDNQDQGVPHNVSIYTQQGGEALFQGEGTTEPGPTQFQYEVGALEEGEATWFQCDVHPTTMNGTFVVA